MTGGGVVMSDDFSQHRRRLQRSPGPLAGFEGWEGERGRKGGERRRKEVKGEEVGERENGWKKKGRGNGRGSEGRDDTPLFGTKCMTPMSVSDIHTRRIGLRQVINQHFS